MEPHSVFYFLLFYDRLTFSLVCPISTRLRLCQYLFHCPHWKFPPLPSASFEDSSFIQTEFDFTLTSLLFRTVVPPHRCLQSCSSLYSHCAAARCGLCDVQGVLAPGFKRFEGCVTTPLDQALVSPCPPRKSLSKWLKRNPSLVETASFPGNVVDCSI